MKQYHLANNIIGWVICLIACAVYVMTAEATASWWDCGEYVSTAVKLEVGHPQIPIQSIRYALLLQHNL